MTGLEFLDLYLKTDSNIDLYLTDFLRHDDFNSYFLYNNDKEKLNRFIDLMRNDDAYMLNFNIKGNYDITESFVLFASDLDHKIVVRLLALSEKNIYDTIVRNSKIDQFLQ